jgi:sulfite reductase alpha subunit-like flavoprotein
LLHFQSNDRTTSDDHFQDVRLVSFQCDLKWEIGDVAYVRPKNSEEAVDKLFEIFKEYDLDFADGNECCVLLEDDEEIAAPRVLRKPLTLRTIATQFWDLNAKPKPRAFAVLAYNCENELEKEKLVELSSYEGQEDWLNYVNRPRRTVLEFLQDFPHATSKLTLELLFELFQPIKQRPFSIASSPLSKQLDLLVAVVEYYTNLKAQRKGFCSNWLKNLQVGDCVRISIKKGTFKFPREISTPLVMVGPGTGLAIFRGIIQDFELKGESSDNKLVLFFGCRYAEKDFHCRDEFLKFESEGKLKLFCAFSRDQDQKM